MAEKSTPTIRTPKGRLSFPSVFEPSVNDDGASRYETRILFPEDADTSELLAALEAVAVEAWGKDKAKWPKRVRGPEDVIRDASEKTYKGYEAGWTFMSAAQPALGKNGKPREAPSVIDALRQPVTDESEVYAGRWARLAVRPYHYKNKSEGVTFALVGVQLLQHDDRLSGVDVKTLFDDEALDMVDDDV